MVEIMPFGKYATRSLSVEQIALEDYKYFVWALGNIQFRIHSLGQRFRFVEHVANNFVSVVNCAREGCENPATLISIYHNWEMNFRGSSSGFVYCSSDCFGEDSKAEHGHKTGLYPLGFRTAVSSTKIDTNRLVKVIAECMGLSDGKKTKKYLEDFFNTRQLWTPYSG